MMAGMLRRRDTQERQLPAWLRIARDRLHDDLWSDHCARELAACAGVHPGYFARQFRRFFGKSVGAYLRQVRLDWAATELRQTRRSLSELAHVARFSDHSHFTREFKRAFGMPPRAYRERYS
jgi:AraC family transcriptional regulator